MFYFADLFTVVASGNSWRSKVKILQHNDGVLYINETNLMTTKVKIPDFAKQLELDVEEYFSRNSTDGVLILLNTPRMKVGMNLCLEEEVQEPIVKQNITVST